MCFMRKPGAKLEWLRSNGGAERHHYSMFNVGSSMFDVFFYCFTWIKKLKA